jgi:hypothetical protein
MSIISQQILTYGIEFHVVIIVYDSSNVIVNSYVSISLLKYIMCYNLYIIIDIF